MKKLLIVAALLCATSASAQTCAPRAALIGALTESLSVTRQMGGLDVKARLIEIWANEETGDWFAVLTRPDQISCIVSSGNSFSTFDEKAGDAL